MTDTLTQLAELPQLAAERFLTIGHPNPVERPARNTRTTTPQTPADLEAHDTLRTDTKGQLHRLTQCVRGVLETMHDHNHWDHPDPGPTPTWTTETHWLTTTHPWWTNDPWCLEYVTHEVDSIWRHMRQSVRTPTPTWMICPDCHARAEIYADGWLACDNGHEHNTRDYAQKLITRESIGTQAAAEEFHITPERIRKWHQRGKITPVASAGKAHLWRPWDIFRQLYPILAKDITRTVADTTTQHVS